MEPYMNEYTLSPNRRNEQYEDYPLTRFVLDVEPGASLQDINIPTGPWEYKNEPLPTIEEVSRFTNEGYETDSLGRPLHPWAAQILSSELRGAVIGKGFYWNWGPNRTADPIIITDEARPQILLITRGDNGQLALPGGFVDDGELPIDSATREANQETGIADLPTGSLVYQGPVADPRTTLNAWAETSAFLFTVPETTPVKGGDDARDAAWYYLDEINEELHGSHTQLIALALEQLDYKGSLKKLLAVPEKYRTVTHLQAGHMAYHHYVTTYTNNDSAFVKQHDPAFFTDPSREAHSRLYLEKEHATYKHLASQGFTAIPRRVEFIDNTILAMDHLAEADGWQWRLPTENSDAYISDILKEFSNLQAIDPTELTQFHEKITPSYKTFWREGWDDIDDITADKIAKRVAYFANEWKDDQKIIAKRLVDSLQKLKTQASQRSRTPTLFMAHNDARQSNIAWHPEHGVKIIDWSWADAAPQNADATMFLIDLAKADYPTENYHQYINPDFAHTLIGFWLAHSIWETRDASLTVREHQVASACAAFAILEKMT